MNAIVSTDSPPATTSSHPPPALTITQIFKSDNAVIHTLKTTAPDDLDAKVSSLSDDELDQFESQACKRVSSLRSKNLITRIATGFVLTGWQIACNRNDIGFTRCLRRANMSRRRAYECIDLYKLFADVCGRDPTVVNRFGIEAAQLLARRSTATELKTHFMDRAMDGERITHAMVKEALKPKHDSTSPNRIEDRYFHHGIKILVTIDDCSTLSDEQIADAFKAAWHSTRKTIDETFIDVNQSTSV